MQGDDWNYLEEVNLFLFKYALNSKKLIFPASFAIFSIISVKTFTVVNVFSFLIFVFIVHYFSG